MKTFASIVLLSLPVVAQSVGTRYGPTFIDQPTIFVWGNPRPGQWLNTTTVNRNGRYTTVLVGSRPLALSIDFGQTILVDPSTTVRGLSVTEVEDGYIHRIPSDPRLVGARLYYQWAHFETSRFWLTQGVELEILP